MKKIFKIIFSLAVVCIIFFFFHSQIEQVFFSLENKYLPCSRPITYSIGSFDDRFGISKDEFIKVVNTGEMVWEKAINKDLFIYKSDGSGVLKINLIYDIRQEATEKLKEIGITVNDTKASYDELKLKYNIMQTDYFNSKKSFELQINLLQNRQNAYEKEVSYLNENGGASKKEFDRLNTEKRALEVEFIEINKLQTQLNFDVDNINSLAIVLNRLILSLNIEVNKFNTIGDQLGGEFEEGTYKEDAISREIDIYQFDNIGKLARVLTHEFGHALGLGHLESPESVMYRLNNGVNEKLTIEDILALKKRCELAL
ncbi:MAG: Peptidase M10A and M12B matrixin and adamalysin [Candidatus Nomurabacteria bacterium GW2011_GWE1_32_28]|uniref:Peptidase M10A and M12B matrixin and adamalysin n=1 Tax=Candidatus Nomurabacteria bacterium GW2011_GWF1_31_48 TaxID=1618767 RepID=A0A0G0AUZ0_9BACT|nr:MAG: Peptidase M10A and M12B matrixin and adamalysin [Candidatus Nomurabacteria bacterium GW2011_GWF2_30_133]KKP29095.1 MAG: Peptidase M10A and M12B matrixin and adamalysin [Candidatus Nomurabacteria bacterium GW2011_GWE2_31_40]KKP30495.1 MAG: Peptidase M10A and M12B matrixin and adamalysin [Candidatus Nomurabacteria bacterium GW2011_GWF1_31_48]KKP34980.1 MAG: Peptidase M10A and M12B matrixin and adamalysin [Candidatus Nomurabacteria bacterium GW2011_GWE1_32_28]HAS80652.1 hypothetical protei